jgi:hypothetical protein
MLAIKGIGKDTVVGFFSEVGDLSLLPPKADYQTSWA